MTPEPMHVFWAKRWKAAHDIARRDKRMTFVAEMNQMAYLSEVFSWYFENWQVYTIRRKANG